MLDQSLGRVNWLGQNCVILVAFATAPGCPTDLRIGTSALFGPNTAEPGAHVSWRSPTEPITLTACGPAGEVAVPLLPKRALSLAQELLTKGVQAIKADYPG